MVERLNKLLTVKSLVTLMLSLVFCYLAVIGVVSGQEFLTVFTTVIAFYYGTQKAKKETTTTDNGHTTTTTTTEGTND